MSFSLVFRTLPAGFLAAAVLIGASPASAQTEATAAQISSTVHRLSDGPDSPLGKGDDEFTQLFANWKSLDNGTGIAMPAVRTTVSVPSRSPLAKALLTSGYGMRTHPVLGGRRNHKGLDLAAPTGTPVYAPADGLIARADWFSSYGNYIQIEHGGELQTRYGHLSGFAVHAGDRVHKGDLIGYVGTTGRSTGPHLHYEVRVAGESVDPTPYLAGEVSLASLGVADAAMGGPDD
ncbi:MAG: M23 family metallopeptidase [Candidatus Andeanibacterium colombiense]|uniref:M23 family metallopeptidase n=1 Tax=Candidatus Andeanibacterium colombiense TaxID=3121345 RepID=A0AAJ5X4E3_9SPHN|nr:MAG: M23 family metallopeptidase [Sphingomonadaceae bacterium]